MSGLARCARLGLAACLFLWTAHAVFNVALPHSHAPGSAPWLAHVALGGYFLLTCAWNFFACALVEPDLLSAEAEERHVDSMSWQAAER